MMTSTQESIAEAKRALNEYLRRERDASLSRPVCAGATFQTEGGSDTPSNNGDDLGRIVNEARESARRYAESKAKNTRPVRQVDETNASAVEGRDSALAFIEKRRRSVIRK
jgi:hypothetical protein